MKREITLIGAVVGFIAAIVTIFAFLTGYVKLSDIPRPWPAFMIEQIPTTSTPTVTGRHHLAQDTHVWLFYVDAMGQYYLLAPVSLSTDKIWRVDVSQPGKEMSRLVAVAVAREGDEEIQLWLRKGRFDSITEKEVTSLTGYTLLDDKLLHAK